MSPMKIFEKIHVGDVVQMRKPHACGNDIWEVYRVGVDIGMTCRQCQRRGVDEPAQFHPPHAHNAGTGPRGSIRDRRQPAA